MSRELFGVLEVFSTHVEVIPIRLPSSRAMSGILHACGGDPEAMVQVHQFGVVFSTHVEVILGQRHSCQDCRSILHACGGDPLPLNRSSRYYRILHACGGDPGATVIVRLQPTYSPRMWR